MTATRVREMRLGTTAWRQFYDEPQLGARYECCKCAHRWVGIAGPVNCPECGNLWARWLNYGAMFPDEP